jgi:hypothetical protein
LLLEPQRTNLLTFSEQFNNAAWAPTRSTITANTSISPDGTQNAETFTDSTFTNSNSFIDRAVSVTTGQAYTYSVFVKAGTAPHIFIGIYDNPSSYYAIISASSGQITFATSGATASVVSYGNGWYRVSITRTVGTVTVYPFIGVCQLSNSITYNGTGAYTARMWGAQLEAGSYATSYVKTEAAAVTRVADAASKTGISSLIGQTEGTLFAEINWVNNSVDSVFATLSDGTTNNRIHFGNAATGTWYLYSEAGAATQVNITTPTPVNGKYKIAVAYKLNDYAFYINGVQIGVDNSATVPATSQINVGGFITAGLEQSVNQALVFKTRLTNAQLAELTTL